MMMVLILAGIAVAACSWGRHDWLGYVGLLLAGAMILQGIMSL